MPPKSAILGVYKTGVGVSYLKKQNGAFHLGIISAVVAVLTILYAVFNLDQLFFGFMATGLIILPFLFFVLSYKKAEENSIAKKLFYKDFSAMQFFMNAKYYQYLKFVPAGKNRKLKAKRASTFMRWLVYYKTEPSKNFHARVLFEKETVYINLDRVEKADVSFISRLFDLESKLLRDLEVKRESDIRLVVYLLLCCQYEDMVDRAVILHARGFSPEKAYLINRLSASISDYDTFLDVPESWLLHLLTSDSKKATNERG